MTKEPPKDTAHSATVKLNLKRRRKTAEKSRVCKESQNSQETLRKTIGAASIKTEGNGSRRQTDTK